MNRAAGKSRGGVGCHLLSQKGTDAALGLFGGGHQNDGTGEFSRRGLNGSVNTEWG